MCPLLTYVYGMVLTDYVFNDKHTLYVFKGKARTMFLKYT